jgi:hypothetical protein
MKMAMLKQEYLAIYEQLIQSPANLEDLDNRNSDLVLRLNVLLEAAHKDGAYSENIFIGTIPISTINAQAVKVQSGFLLLINEGLMIFALQTAVLVASLAPADSKGAIIPPDIDVARARHIFREWVLALVNNNAKSELDFLPSRSRLDFARFLFASLVDFVIAHELSHVLCKHLEQEEPLKPREGLKNLEHYYKSWQQEMEADLVGMKLVKKIYCGQVREESMYLGPALFFEIEDAIIEISTGQRATAISSHPDSAARRAAIITNTHSDGFLVRVPRVDYVVEIMNELRRSYG